MNIGIANTGNILDVISGGFVRLYDGSVPFLLWLADGTTLNTIYGQIIFTQG
jgi:hypothetical protein